MNIKPLFIRHRATLRRCITVLAVFSLVLSNVQLAFAAALTNQRDYLNTQKAGTTTGVQHQIFFTTVTAVSGGAGNNKVIVLFPDADDGLWCTAGSITVTGITNPTGATESATSLPGTLATSTCAAGSGSGSADSNSDRLLINTVNDLTSATKYGLQVVQNAGTLKTPATPANNIKVIVKTNNGSADVDSNTLALSTISNDLVVVTAVVDVTLSVTLNTNAVALGTLATATIAKGAITTQISTSAAGGYISLVKYDVTLTAGAFTIPNSGGTVTEGTSGYGASSSDVSGAANAIADWSPTNCTTGTTGVSNATSLSTTFQDYASSATAVTNETTTLCFIAAISGTQQPGAYTSTATVVTTARF